MNSNPFDGSKTNLMPSGQTASSFDGSQTNLMPNTPPTSAPSEDPAPKSGRVRPYRSRRVAAEHKIDMHHVAIGLAALFLGFIGCVHFFLAMNKPTKGEYQSQKSGDLFIALRTADTEDGQMRLQLSVSNTGPVTANLRFNRGPKYDFVVQRHVNLFFFSLPIEVWRYSKQRHGASPDSIATSDNTVLPILPNEEKVFKATWNYTDNDGAKLDEDNSSRLTIMGELKSVGDPRSLQLNN